MNKTVRKVAYAATALVSPPVYDRVFTSETQSDIEDVEPPSRPVYPSSIDYTSENVTNLSLSLPLKSERTTVTSRTLFRKNYYPGVTKKEWDDWRWQLTHRITRADELSRMLKLSGGELQAISGGGNLLPFAITPYYASLLDPDNPSDPLRLTVVPTANEFYIDPSDMIDPLCEEHDEVTPGLIHRYPDRVLFLATSFCSTYCRYCTRSRIVGENKSEECGDKWSKAINYIKTHTEIRDVLISGGDPLTLPDEALENILSRVRAIPHIEFIRIGTKVPTVLPQRITTKLTRMLRKYHPLFISVHAAHAAEFTPEAVKACARLADAGIPLGSQTVLLKGVNDNLADIKRLMHKLLMSRVRPYYMYQCDPVRGTSHFRTSVAKGLEIISGLRGFTSGYAIPTFVIDSPGGGGKVPVNVNSICGTDGDDLLLINYEGKVFRYPQNSALSGDSVRNDL
ncbi:MAG: KamA family radical SAM protein [Deferribacteraceae bacterium]|jgi:lysine 2,3-aminomutase|nr:KamA family radical SAM protein [Deferribacteraceae bacterium]